jgi:hypothetical protein
LNPRPQPTFSKVALYDSITSSSKSGAAEREHNCSNSTPLPLLKVVLCLVETAIEEIDTMIQGVQKYNNTSLMVGKKKKKRMKKKVISNKFNSYIIPSNRNIIISNSLLLYE